MVLLEVEGLRRSFRRSRGEPVHVAVDDASFTLAAGATLAVVGESGAGKSTTGRLVLRLIEPDAGRITLGGCTGRAAPGRCAGGVRSSAGAGRARRRPGRSLPGLSEGKLQRAGIARAVATDPELVVCDEPVPALDVSIRAQVLDLLADLQRERGIAYLLVTHDLALVEGFADEVMVMRSGAVVEVAAGVAHHDVEDGLASHQVLRIVDQLLQRVFGGHRWSRPW